METEMVLFSDQSAAQADAISPSHQSVAELIGHDAIAWAVRTLRRHQMLPEEIIAVLDADDPELVRRYMELHREWLEERLADTLRTLAGLERFLVQAVVSQRESSMGRRGSASWLRHSESRTACCAERGMTSFEVETISRARTRPIEPDHAADWGRESRSIRGRTEAKDARR